MNIKICNEVTALIVISHNVILIENAEAQLEQNTKKKKKHITHLLEETSMLQSCPLYQQ